MLTSCSNSDNAESSSAQSDEVVFDDGYKTTVEGEIVIDDESFEGKEKAIETDGKSSQEITRIAQDGSKLEVMYDGFGNKTETRYFYNNQLLRQILLRTRADGSRQVFVYGQNGTVESLPDNMLDKVLTAPASELANAAGIFEGLKEPAFTQSSQTLSVTALKPLPSSQFPIRNQQVVQALTPETEESSDSNDEKPQSVENKNNDEPTAKTKKQISLDKKSDEKQ